MSGATGLTIAAFLVAVAGLVYAWLVRQDLDRAVRRLDRHNRALYDASDQIRRLEERLASTTAELRAEIARRSGQAAFHPGMSVRESYALHPQAQEVLAAYHMGGCSHCAVDLDATIQDVCMGAGVDVDQVIRDMNTLLNGEAVHDNAVRRMRLPNLSLELE